MALYLFAGIAVSDFAGALAWYEKLLGAPPSFFPHDTEAVWELAEGRWCTSCSGRSTPATPCTPSSWMTWTRWPPAWLGEGWSLVAGDARGRGAEDHVRGPGGERDRVRPGARLTGYGRQPGLRTGTPLVRPAGQAVQDSRSRSAWPVCRAYSSVMSSSISRTLAGGADVDALGVADEGGAADVPRPGGLTTAEWARRDQVRA